MVRSVIIISGIGLLNIVKSIIRSIALSYIPSGRHKSVGLMIVVCLIGLLGGNHMYTAV